VSGRAGSEPAPDAPSSAHRRRSLTWRLGAFIAVVVSVALLVMVAVSGAAMRQWMTANIDDDLQDNLHRVSSRQPLEQVDGRGEESAPPVGPSAQEQSGALPDLQGPGSTEGALLLVSEGESVRSGMVQDYEVVALEPTVQSQLLDVDADGRGHTVRLEGIGSYRVAAEDTDTGRVVVGQSLAPSNRTATTLMWVEGVLAVLLAAVVAVIAWRWVRREMRPLAHVASTARRIGALDLRTTRLEPFDRVDTANAPPGTEVGDVGQALNTMIDNVESALTARAESEQQLRQFVADASHELRTPLASIQGYTQLLQKDSIEADLALARISSESQRMSGLVEDMLLLARLDAGRELTLIPVDVVPLVIDAVSDAHAAGPDHQWALDIDIDEDAAAAACVVRGDERGLRQVLANLLANARVHTPAGTRVVVGVHSAGDEVRVTVADDGPGIAPEVQARVFDRFVRGDTSRSRAGTGSSGLGLSIVDSIAHTLGGHVDLDSSAQGTTFTVVLPHLGATSAQV